MTTTDNPIAEATAIIEAARLGVEPVELELGSVYAVVGADGDTKVIDLATDEHRRRLGQTPIRKTGHAQLAEHPSFAAYVNDHKVVDATTMWGDRDAGRVIAVFNGHTKDDLQEPEFSAGWGDHRATLTLRKTPAWTAWTAASGKFLGQVQFAELLEDRAGDVVDPDHAVLLEIAGSIEGAKGAAFKSGYRDDNGQVQVRYEETIDARAGQAGNLTIPTRIELGIAPFEGMDLYKVTARFRYRISNGELSLGIVLDRPEDVLRAAFGDVVDAVERATDLTVLHGTPMAGA